MRKKELPLACGIALVYLVALYWLSRDYTFFPFLLGAVGLLSLITLLCYGFDKRAAARQAQRTPEKTLHLLAVAGGWPGALIARPLFRHKTRKQPFTGIFWTTVMVSSGLLGSFLLLEQTAAARDWLDVEALQWRFFVQQYLSA